MIEIRAPVTAGEWEKYYDIRYRLLRKQLGVAKGEEKKPEDNIAEHLAAFRDGTPIGIGMVYEEGKNARIRFIAVEEKHQHEGIGSLLIAALEGLARKKGLKKAVLWGDESAVGFYEKLGYKNAGKGPVLLGKIQQYNMEKEL
ncbi:MAG: GNAT family N-acetyltransferase [Candidatus Micrarchaeia archaeon]